MTQEGSLKFVRRLVVLGICCGWSSHLAADDTSISSIEDSDNFTILENSLYLGFSSEDQRHSGGILVDQEIEEQISAAPCEVGRTVVSFPLYIPPYTFSLRPDGTIMHWNAGLRPRGEFSTFKSQGCRAIIKQKLVTLKKRLLLDPQRFTLVRSHSGGWYEAQTQINSKELIHYQYDYSGDESCAVRALGTPGPVKFSSWSDCDEEVTATQGIALNRIDMPLRTLSLVQGGSNTLPTADLTNPEEMTWVERSANRDAGLIYVALGFQGNGPNQERDYYLLADQRTHLVETVALKSNVNRADNQQVCDSSKVKINVYPYGSKVAGYKVIHFKISANCNQAQHDNARLLISLTRYR